MSSSSPERQGNPEDLLPSFQNYTNRLNSDLEDKYQRRQPTNVATKDALTYAAAELACHKIEPLFDPDVTEKDLEFADRIVSLWEEAIKGARVGDLSSMISALQDYARASSSAAAILESWREDIPTITSGEESERRSHAFVNLIRSLTP